MSKKYQELRPFDLEALKRGEKVCWYTDGEVAVEVFFVRDQAVPVFETSLQECQCGVFSLSECSEYLRMAPLCWVEGRPVYKGDTLYHRYGDEVTELVVDRLGSYSTPSVLQEGSGIGWHINALTWKAPKVKREGWIAVKTGEKPQSYASWCSHVCETKEQAENHYGSNSTCIHIEWEEEA